MSLSTLFFLPLCISNVMLDCILILVLSNVWFASGSKARVLDLVRAEGWEDVLAAIEATPEGGIFERALHDRPPPPRWVSAAGRVVLVGDAAHAMHPGPGMGGRMAFEVGFKDSVGFAKS